MLKKIKLENFRSYKSFDISFDKNITIIYGPNAVGKTNLLESVFVSSTSKSFRGKDNQLVKEKEDFFRVEAFFEKQKVSLSYQPLQKKKNLKIDNVKKTPLDLIGINPVSLFEPNDMNLLYGPPSNRRKFLDVLLIQADEKYSYQLLKYRHILRQRNKLLSQAKQKKISVEKLSDQLFVWNMQLVEPIYEIVKKRNSLIEKINIIISKYYEKISQKKVHILIKYQPSIDCEKEEILKELDDKKNEELRFGYSISGPHRDDFEVNFNNKKMKLVASRGEVRTFILALKMAELDLIESFSQKRPILLLDDVFSELDQDRRNYLVQALNDQQTIITTAEIIDKTISKAKLIDLTKEIKNG